MIVLQYYYAFRLSFIFCQKQRKDENLFGTYTVDSIDEWIVAAVAHGEPVGNEKDDVDITVARRKKRNINLSFTCNKVHDTALLKIA